VRVANPSRRALESPGMEQQGKRVLFSSEINTGDGAKSGWLFLYCLVCSLMLLAECPEGLKCLLWKNERVLKAGRSPEYSS